MIQNMKTIKENLTYYENLIKNVTKLENVDFEDYKEPVLIEYVKPTILSFDTFEETNKQVTVNKVLVTEKDLYLYVENENGEERVFRGVPGRDFNYINL